MMIGSVSTTTNAMTPAAVKTAAASPVPQTPQTPQTPASPSVIVTLSGPDAAVQPPTYAPPKPSLPLWERSSQDTVTALMARNYTSAPVGGRFMDVGKALLERFAQDGTDFSQSVRPSSGLGPANAGPPSDTTLTITTARGAKVTLSLHNTADGFGVTMQSYPPLDDVERGAVAKLAGAFQDAVDGMVAVPPKLDLGGLTAFDPSVLASVDLQSISTNGQGETQSIAFHADGDARTVKVDGPGGKLDVGVDMRSQAILGNAAQRASAVDNYMKQFDRAASRGRADPSLMSLFKDAFSQMALGDGTSAPVTSRPITPSTLSASDHAMLTGLADFHASVTQTSKAINPKRPDETDAFAYEASQDTRLSGGNAKDRSISQQQKSHLTAGFHTSLGPDWKLLLTDDPKSQNYFYTQIDDSADSTTDIAYRKGRLVTASVTQSASQSTHQLKYVMGERVGDTTTHVKESRTRDRVALLRPFLENASPRTKQQEQLWQQTLLDLHAGTGLESDPTALGSLIR